MTKHEVFSGEEIVSFLVSMKVPFSPHDLENSQKLLRGI